MTYKVVMFKIVDVDECAAVPSPCDSTNGDCMNSPAGSYTCTCDSGYVLNMDGINCDGTFILI